MKSIVLLFSILSIAGILSAQTWTWSTPPEAGMKSEARIAGLSPDDGPYHVAYYYFDGTKFIAQDAGLIPTDQGDQINAQIVLPDNCSWVAVVLKDKYFSSTSSTEAQITNPKALPTAGKVERALGIAQYSRFLGMKKDDEACVNLFHDAVQADPKWLDQPDVLRVYYNVASAAKSTTDMDLIKMHLQSMAKKPKEVPEALLVQSTRLAKTMADTVLTTSLRKALDKSYPKNILVQEDAFAAYGKITAVDDQIKQKDAFITKYGITDLNRNYVTQMTSTIAAQFAGKEDWEKARTYVFQEPDPLAQASDCNEYAWKLSGESTDKEGSHYDIAEDLSSTSLRLLSSNPSKPVYMTKEEWDSNLEYRKSQFGDTYALIRFKQGHVDDAIDHQLYAVQKSEYEDSDINERYAIYLEAAGQKEDLKAFLDKIIVMGKASVRVKDIHKNLWTKESTNDELYAQYMKQLDEKAHQLIEEKVRKMWKNDEPVAFTLKDLDGNTVSLSDYKGKTVVLDFWATWCGPCKASFPGMKQTVQNFASDKDVVFLFVDTWENKDNKESRASTFIHDNNYPFHVLMDTDNAVVGNYKVDGIPTKFIIGPDQKVHFVSVGFGGSTDELVEEMQIMIEMTKTGGSVRS